MKRYYIVYLSLLCFYYSCSTYTIHGIFAPYKQKPKYNTGGDWFVFYSNNRFTYQYSTEVREERCMGNYQIIGKRLELSSDTDTKDLPIKIIQSKNSNPNQYHFVIKIDSAYTLNYNALRYFLITINNQHDTIEYPIAAYDSISIKKPIVSFAIMVKVTLIPNIIPPDVNLVYRSRLDSIVNNNNMFHIIFDFPYRIYSSYRTLRKEQFLIENRKKLLLLRDSLIYYRK